LDAIAGNWDAVHASATTTHPPRDP
jgi:hypothetical protein